MNPNPLQKYLAEFFTNPAVTIARSFTDTFSGIVPIHMPEFILLQLIGGVSALAVCKVLLPADEKHV